MGRELKRVPFDFDWPLGEIWHGYVNQKCNTCEDDACDHCPTRFDPPDGNCFQLWETTTEGSPVSPVFETLADLCEWCEDNATTFANWRATKEQWMEMLNNKFVHHREGNVIFI